MQKENIKLCCISILLIIFDQLIKFLIIKNIPYSDNIILIPNFLRLTCIYNTGAALGILGNNLLLLVIISFILLIYLFKELKNNTKKLHIISILIIISGSFGNLIDRIFRGYVIDYISFTLFNKDMPIFNFADMLISFGVMILVYEIIRGEKHDKNN